MSAALLPGAAPVMIQRISEESASARGLVEAALVAGVSQPHEKRASVA